MTAAARLGRTLRHRLGDALIGWGARLTADAVPPLDPERAHRIRRAVAMARAVLDAEDAARARRRRETDQV